MGRVGRALAFTKSCRGTRTEKLRSTRGSTELLVGAGSLRRVAGSEAAVLTQHVRSTRRVSTVVDEVNESTPTLERHARHEIGPSKMKKPAYSAGASSRGVVV
jgi:hypothetical protein